MRNWRTMRTPCARSSLQRRTTARIRLPVCCSMKQQSAWRFWLVFIGDDDILPAVAREACCAERTGSRSACHRAARRQQVVPYSAAETHGSVWHRCKVGNRFCSTLSRKSTVGTRGPQTECMGCLSRCPSTRTPRGQPAISFECRPLQTPRDRRLQSHSGHLAVRLQSDRSRTSSST
jgi:hypothetical protein